MSGIVRQDGNGYRPHHRRPAERAYTIRGERTHLSMVEYGRWRLVHLRVEGFFEVFATAVI